MNEENVVYCDDYIWKMGQYFVYFDLHAKRGWTFEEFLDKCERGMFHDKGLQG